MHTQGLCTTSAENDAFHILLHAATGVLYWGLTHALSGLTLGINDKQEKDVFLPALSA